MLRRLPFRLVVLLTLAVTGAAPVLACSRPDHAAADRSALAVIQDDEVVENRYPDDGEHKPEVIEMAAGDVNPMTQLAGSWVVTEIASAELPSGPDITLDFNRFRLSGTATCNRFEAAVKFTDIGIGFGPVNAGDEICNAEMMAVETALFEALGTVDRYEVDEDDNLTFYGSNVVALRARR